MEDCKGILKKQMLIGNRYATARQQRAIASRAQHRKWITWKTIGNAICNCAANAKAQSASVSFYMETKRSMRIEQHEMD